MIVKDKQTFNLMNTNGRRKDVVFAHQLYLKTLNTLLNENNLKWGTLPNEFTQFVYYENVLNESSHVFTKHDKYDSIKIEIEKNSRLKKAFEARDTNYMKDNKEHYAELLTRIDKSIESRSRHYISNLKKIGFISNSNDITSVGRILLNSSEIKRDQIEELLAIDDINLIYLRQMLKFRIYNKEKTKSYSPFFLALSLLSINTEMNESEFLRIIQSTHPNDMNEKYDINKINLLSSNFLTEKELKILEKNQNTRLTKQQFKNVFYRNEETYSEKSYELYKLIIEATKNEKKKTVLINYIKKNKELIKNHRQYKALSKCTTIIKLDNWLNNGEENINLKLNNIYVLDYEKKKLKDFKDTTKRIFQATGIITFSNATVTLEYRKLFSEFFTSEFLEKNIFKKEKVNSYKLYQKNYFDIKSIVETKPTSASDLAISFQNLCEEYKVKDISLIKDIEKKQKIEKFNKFILSTFTKEKLVEILKAFKIRDDEKVYSLTKFLSPIPTQYEFFIGIAFFYLFNEKINLLNSFNLSLNTSFEPQSHATGNKGDIEIEYKNYLLLIEVTLMNLSQQRRNEWEPVLRHSINLKSRADKEKKKFLTFFIANEFDINTINIWRAVSLVDLATTDTSKTFTKNVRIMPLNTMQLVEGLDSCLKPDRIIDVINHSFNSEKFEFDSKWREKILEELDLTL